MTNNAGAIQSDNFINKKDQKMLADTLNNYFIKHLADLRSLTHEINITRKEYIFYVLHDNDRNFLNWFFKSPAVAIKETIDLPNYDINDKYVYITRNGKLISCNHYKDFYTKPVVKSLTERIACTIKTDDTIFVHLYPDIRILLEKVLKISK